MQANLKKTTRERERMRRKRETVSHLKDYAGETTRISGGVIKFANNPQFPFFGCSTVQYSRSRGEMEIVSVR